jgi:hypothetical protein
MEHGAGRCPAEIPGQLHRMSGQASEPRLRQADPLRTLGGGTEGDGLSAGFRLRIRCSLVRPRR